MKLKSNMQKWLPAVITGLALAGSTALAQYSIATFDTDVSVIDGIGGGVAGTDVWAATGNPGGSAYITEPYANVGGWQETQFSLDSPFPWPGVQCQNYINVEFDIKVDITNSTLDAYGNYGYVQVIGQGWDGGPCNNSGLGWFGFNTMTIANTPGWQHYSAPLAGFNGCMNRLILDFHENLYGTYTNWAGTCSYWVDNIQFTTPPVPPSSFTNVGNQKIIGTLPCGGLVFYPRQGGEYERCMVYPGPVGPSMGWYGNTPATYSWSISQWPPPSTGYNLNVFWVPTNAMQNGQADGAVDWNCTNDLILNYNAGNITWSAKTNLPGANPNVALANIPYTGPVVGTWTVKFTDDTDLILTTPDGTPHPLAIDPVVANIVSGNSLGNTAMQVYLGIMPGENYNIAVPCVWTNIQISIPAAGVSINDSFCPIDPATTSAPDFLNTNVWAELGVLAYADCCQGGTLLPPWPPLTSALTLSWLVGAYQLPNSLLIGPCPKAQWQGFIDPTNWYQVASVPPVTQVAIHQSDLNAALGNGNTSQAYFELVKRVASQLQVLLPGETNAPGTPTGKGGTPLPQTVDTPFDLVINACDSTWHITPSGDTVAITSSDTSAWLPPNATLVNGTVTISGNFFFGTAGTWTVTATDQPPGTLSPGVSSTVTAQ